ncbi:hybrid sensor histidine kinase/response regulator transcription factor [Aquimarina latercula]|uniref:hybrid sensor histidine kinase/response regulator transcription factor n=1 Tax=Aquimarina latercula TaxID=987 RepID=UPI0004284B64|nr:two-component regulator propeller domain-containing protein [Aquimarina latercula]
MISRFLISIFFFVFSINYTYCQSQSIFKKISQANGLSNNSITSIAKGNNNFLWIGTKNGLNRYDGYQVKVYNKQNSDLSANDISDILLDSKGRLWIATIGGGLNLYNSSTDSFTIYTNSIIDEDSLPSNQVNIIFEDTKNNIWIGTENGLSHFLPESDKFITYKHDEASQYSISYNSVTSIFQDSIGILWIGTFGGGLNKFDTTSEKFHKILSKGQNVFSDFINDISYLNNEELLLGTSGNGILVYNTVESEFSDFFKDELELKQKIKIVRTIYHDSKDILWIGTDGDGVFQYQNYNSPKPKLKIFSHNSQLESSISGNAIYDIQEDEDGNIWIGTAWDGLNCLKENDYVNFLFSDITRKNTYPVLSIFKDQDLLFMGLDGNGLSIFGSSEYSGSYFNSDTRKSISGEYVQFITKDQDSSYWIGTFAGGLINFDLETGSFTRYLHNPLNNSSLSYNDVRDIVKDKKEGLWVATWGGGLNYFNSKIKKFTSYRAKDSVENTINSNNIVGLEKDGDSLWMATFGGGLNLFNTKTLRFKHFTHNKIDEKSLSSNNLLSIFKDSKNNLWVGTSGEGINRLDIKTGRFDRFDEEQNIKDLTITGILEDNDEKIWFSTKQGIFNYEYKTNSFNSFYDLKGEFHINSVYKDTLGLLYFGHTKGVIRFDPKKIINNRPYPEVKLTSFKLFNKEVEISNKSILDKNIVSEDYIELKHNLDVITFEFTALMFPFSENLEYSIKMENFDRNWRDIGTDHTVTYTSLPSGSYIFKVKSKIKGSGEWGNNYASLRLKILKPFWLEWWSFVCYGIMILFMFYAFRKYIVAWERMKTNLKLEKLSREKDAELYIAKQQFFTNISHEIRTPVTLILGAINQLYEKYDGKESKQNNFVKIIKKNGNNLFNLVNELLDFRKLDTNNIELKITKNEFVEYCKEIYLSFTELATQKNIEFHFNSNISETIVWYDKIQIEKVIYNLVSNALKFTSDGGIVSINLEATSEHVLLIIKDSGIGMYKKQLSKIFNRFYQVDDSLKNSGEFGFGLGLSISKEIIDKHKGIIKVESKKGIGTAFTVALLKGSDYFDQNLMILDNNKTNLELKDVSEMIKVSELSGYKLLVVEDNSEIREYLKILLQEECDILIASNGKEGYELAKKEIPDLIISDIVMPIMDGVTLTKKVKTNIDTSHIPIILLTARASLNHEIKGYDIGADDYITKPFDELLLKSRINNLLNTRKLLRQKFESSSMLIPKNIAANRTDEIFLERLTRIINENIDSESLNASFLSSELGMSHSVIYKKLKSITGMTFIEFVRDFKLKIAKQLIVEHKLTIAEASYQIGYSDKKYFSKLFKQKFGKNPSEFYNKS